jgi:hypothetical protein
MPERDSNSDIADYDSAATNPAIRKALQLDHFWLRGNT